MNVSIGEHVTLLFYSFFIGVFLGALYDVFRLTRTFLGLGIDYTDSGAVAGITPPIIGKRKKRERKRTGRAAATAAIFVFDILYMLAATATTVIFVYHAYSGTPRGFALLGEGIGFVLYMKTAGKLTSSAASYIFFAIDTLVRYLLYFTVTPIKFLIKRIRSLLAKLCRATVRRAVRAMILQRSSSLERRYIEKNLQKTLSEIATAVARDRTES